MIQKLPSANPAVTKLNDNSEFSLDTLRLLTDIFFLCILISRPYYKLLLRCQELFSLYSNFEVCTHDFNYNLDLIIIRDLIWVKIRQKS